MVIPVPASAAASVTMPHDRTSRMKNIVTVRERPCAEAHLLAEEVKICVIRDFTDKVPGRKNEVP